MMVESAFRNTSLPPHFFIWGPCNALGYNGDANQRVLWEQLVFGHQAKKPKRGKETMESMKVYSRKENKTGRRKKDQAQNHNE